MGKVAIGMGVNLQRQRRATFWWGSLGGGRLGKIKITGTEQSLSGGTTHPASLYRSAAALQQ